MRLLVTRPLMEDDSLAVTLSSQGHTVIEEPLLTIMTVAFAPVEVSGLQAVVATSANALRALPRQHGLASLPLYAVGEATARAARAQGFVEVIASGPDGYALAGALSAKLPPAAGAVLYLRGEDIAFDMEAALAAASVTVVSRVVYQAQAADAFSTGTALEFAEGRIQGVLLFSPRTAEIYASCLRHAGLLAEAGSVRHFCLSQRVATPLVNLGINQVSVPPRPNLQELVALIGVNATQSRSHI